MGKGIKIDGKILKELMKEKNYSNRALARKLFDSDNNSQVIAGYINGKGMYKGTLEKLCDILDVSEEHLTGQDTKRKIDRYKSEKDYMREILKSWYVMGENQGINMEFISALRQIVDFDELFPVDGKLVYEHHHESMNNDYYVKRTTNTNVALSSRDDVSVLQLKRNDEIYNMNIFDILFLKDMQDYLIDCAIKYMKDRGNEIQEELTKANSLFIEKRKEHITVNDDGSEAIAFKPDTMLLSAEELNSIVRYKIYTE